MTHSSLPLEGVLVLDFSQFLAGPVAALRLADLGARVIKIERPLVGDIGRTLAFAGLRAGVDTISFHAMNRNKESVAADLKDPAQLEWVRGLVRRADVVIQNFRPGVMERLGLDYATIARDNPGVIYGSITGYGDAGPWKDRPGQDLLAQSISGIPWLQGGDRPIAVGLSIADHLASCHLAHGVTALLLRRARTGEGGHVETSLLESMLDLQFELLSTKLTRPEEVTVQKRGEHSAHSFLSAPYGIYPTADGYVSIAMNPVPLIGRLLELPELEAMTDPQSWWDRQVEIEQLISARMRTAGSEHWLALLDAADVWCAPVHTLEQLVAHDGFAAIDMVQSTSRTEPDGSLTTVRTTRSPLRIDGRTLRSERGAPVLGADTEAVRAELTPTLDEAVNG
ncbi:CoA transferase [Auraticoccus sp. F435]|uniref:CoA transferase n=1 Tax=Auraticoccus cholistanensis TaxID=2656650 RepID=A0A6A9USK6_9ACTN|nr:CaiB/BaiF CoA-transferase family protein [Auraticoccus cholistanensis]MVA74705.1 CoA transferase [Auraticoccus cholistanensis]